MRQLILNHLEDKLRAVIPKEQLEAIWYKGEPIPEGLLEAVDSAALELVQGKYRPRASFYIDTMSAYRGGQKTEIYQQRKSSRKVLA